MGVDISCLNLDDQPLLEVDYLQVTPFLDVAKRDFNGSTTKSRMLEIIGPNNLDDISRLFSALSEDDRTVASNLQLAVTLLLCNACLSEYWKVSECVCLFDSATVELFSSQDLVHLLKSCTRTLSRFFSIELPDIGHEELDRLCQDTIKVTRGGHLKDITRWLRANPTVSSVAGARGASRKRAAAKGLSRRSAGDAPRATGAPTEAHAPPSATQPPLARSPTRKRVGCPCALRDQEAREAVAACGRRHFSKHH